MSLRIAVTSVFKITFNALRAKSTAVYSKQMIFNIKWNTKFATVSAMAFACILGKNLLLPEALRVPQSSLRHIPLRRNERSSGGHSIPPDDNRDSEILDAISIPSIPNHLDHSDARDPFNSNAPNPWNRN
jgi:hypothetical protein